MGFIPNDLSIYQQAFLHRSSSIKTEKGKWINNERLEFLGDAVLDAVVADVVFTKFDTKKEGFLTNTRSKIVQRETLNKLALQLGLDKLVKSSTRSVSHNNYMYGNAFEAFIGAIYVDHGYEACKQFIEERVIAPYINIEKLARKEVNFKSKLIEWSQKNKVKISFELIESFNDQDNNPIFQTQVIVCGIAGGIGTGYSKKESQQNASRATMKKIQGDTAFRAELDAAKAALKKAKKAEEEAAEAETDAEIAEAGIETTTVEPAVTENETETTAIDVTDNASSPEVAETTPEVEAEDESEMAHAESDSTEELEELLEEDVEPSEEAIDDVEAEDSEEATVEESDEAEEPEETVVEESEETDVNDSDETEDSEEATVEESEETDVNDSDVTEDSEEATVEESEETDVNDSDVTEDSEEATVEEDATEEAKSADDKREASEAEEPQALVSMLQTLLEKKSEETLHQA